jgi:hypothetical protein
MALASQPLLPELGQLYSLQALLLVTWLLPEVLAVVVTTLPLIEVLEEVELVDTAPM